MFHVDHADLTNDRSRLAVAQLLQAYLLETAVLVSRVFNSFAWSTLFIGWGLTLRLRR